MKRKTFGLLAAPAVRWLISTESDVKRYIEAFIRDEAPGDRLDVAGPPDIEELDRCRQDPRRKPMLPVVRLTMRKVQHLGAPGIEVRCDDLDKVVSWHEQARLRSALVAKHEPVRLQ